MIRTDCNGCSPISWRLTSSHVPFFVASLIPSSWWKRTASLCQTSGFYSPTSSILLMCGDAFLLLQACLSLSVPLCPFCFILVFPSFTVCASFPYGTTAYDCYPGSSCNECVWSCGKVFILLLSVFLRFEGVMDCLSIASAEVYHRSCILSFLYRSSSNWVVGCRLWLWRFTYHCSFVTVWRSSPRYCENAILRNCKSASLVCEICCWKIQYCAWFALEDAYLEHWKCVAMAASPVVFQLLCSTLWPRLVSVLLSAV